MPILTNQYNLESFIDGDSYSASSDKRRFSTIDNQLHAMSTIIGDGRIDGWEVEELTFPNIQITAGSGFINKYYINTFSPTKFELSENETFYAFVQQKTGIIGAVGPRSNRVTITYTDTGVPTAPANFAVNNPILLDPSFYAELSWTANSEIDFDHYEIERSTDGINFTSRGTTTELSFIDTADEDTSYTYYLYAVDQSGYRSSPSSDTHITTLSSQLPGSPSSITIVPTEGAINILWHRPFTISFENIDYWQITYTLLQGDGVPIDSSSVTINVNKDLYYKRIEDLSNGQLYQIFVYTVDVKGRRSEGIARNAAPIASAAPKDPQNISIIQEELVPGQIALDISWSDGADEYDPSIPYRYNIYITVDGQQESLPIKVPITDNDYQVELYTFDLVKYSSIPQNKLITVRITSLSDSGIESSGNYIRFVTDDNSAPLPVSNLFSDFNQNSGKIKVTWNNNINYHHINMYITDEDLQNNYPPVDLISESIGLVQYFEFAASLGHKYTITVTPVNENGANGLSDVTVEIVSITHVNPPEIPRDILVKIGDKQISLDWLDSSSPYIASYKVYRKTGNISIIANSWTLLDILPKGITEFHDYGLTNDQMYSYYITAVDIYGQESLHLINSAINLNFVEAIPRSSGSLTAPTNLTINLVNNDIIITWDSLLEEFDAFSIYRSIDNLHTWQVIDYVSRDVSSYIDRDVALVDGRVFYYLVNKIINDADIVVQLSNTAPDRSIPLATITTTDSSISVDYDDLRNIKDFADPLTEYTQTYLLLHKHGGSNRFDPSRIDLNPELIITQWDTVDGKIFFTKELDISGTGYILKINGRFPKVLFNIDAPNRRIIFSEPIVQVNAFGNVIGQFPNIELKILGVEEVTGILGDSRFNDFYAKQIAFGRINKEQIIELNHEGRILERLIPKTFLLERYGNQIFNVPQGNLDKTKNFGNGTAFFSIIESDGLIDEVINWDAETTGDIIGFNEPTFIEYTSSNIESLPNISEVSEEEAFQSSKSYHLQFQYIDSDPSRWVRISSENANGKPNPIVDLKKRIKFKILASHSFYLTLGIREISLTTAEVGSNGGTAGSIEWIGTTNILTDENDNPVPVGKLIEASDQWQEVEFDLERNSVYPYSSTANGLLEGKYGVLEHFAFTINPDQDNPIGPIDIYIDKLQQVDDVLVSGTSQGILISRDFGTSWKNARYVETPVHKFYHAQNNSFLWAVAATSVLIATDPANWYETQGLTGVQYIRDIAEDDFGNMYVSTDRGVYWFEIALLGIFSNWRQTQPVTAFSSDCYALYHNTVASGIDEIWVSTELGIFKTSDQGQTWEDSGITTQGLPTYELFNIGDETENIIGITRKHVLRKMGNEGDFSVLANFEIQHDIHDIWTAEYCFEKLYISTGKGVYVNGTDELFDADITIGFDPIFSDLRVNNLFSPAFCLSAIQIGSGEFNLYIGQENRLMVADGNGVLTIKEQFLTRELPSFYAGKTEIPIGFIYNAFNSVLVFREPQPVDVFYSAAHIPRKYFKPEHGGWAQSNPEADIFIYVNGVPRWIDFKINNASIVTEVRSVQQKLLAMTGKLNDLNSLHPNASNELKSLLIKTTTLLEGGTNKLPLVNNATIKSFLESRAKFLSLITRAIAKTFGVDIPLKIQAIGFAPNLRPPNSRASTLENKEDFKALNATGIKIDAVSGEIDFFTIFSSTTNQQEKQKYVFGKHDNLHVSIFNSNISGTGEFSHRELEDKFEETNTGLSSNLSKSYYANLIKTGIFLDKISPFLFDRPDISNIQSKYYSVHDNSWYDTLNSTIDYNILEHTPSINESRFANVLVAFVDNPYLLNKIWIGTDNNILQFSINTNDGSMTQESIVSPNINENYIVWDIYPFTENNIYIIVQNKVTGAFHLFKTIDAVTWEEQDTINLPNELYKFRILNGNKIVVSEQGIYYNDNGFGTWFPSLINPSPGISPNSQSIVSFTKSIRNLATNQFHIAESQGWFYSSSDGINWYALAGQFKNNGSSVINKVHRYKNLTWIATDKGLYNDGNSILGDSIQFGLQSINGSSSVIFVSDVVSGSSTIFCSSENIIYRLRDNLWTNYEVSSFTTIHKLLLFETSTDSFLYVVSHNQIIVLNVTVGTGVFA